MRILFTELNSIDWWSTLILWSHLQPLLDISTRKVFNIPQKVLKLSAVKSKPLDLAIITYAALTLGLPLVSDITLEFLNHYWVQFGSTISTNHQEPEGSLTSETLSHARQGLLCLCCWHPSLWAKHAPAVKQSQPISLSGKPVKKGSGIGSVVTFCL